MTYIISPFIFLAISAVETPTGQALLCLFQPFSYSYMWSNLAVNELSQGATSVWSNQGWDPSGNGGLSLAGVCIMQAVDAVIFLFLAWYFEKVVPQEYGV